MTAFAHRDLHLSFKKSGSRAPSVTVPWFSSIGGAAFGMGAITGINFIFNDDTGVAIALTSICGTISWISGIVGIVSTSKYANQVKSTDTGYLRESQELLLGEFEGRKLRENNRIIDIPLVVVNF